MSEGDVQQNGPVHVHRFNRPQTVSIGSGGWSLPSCKVEELPSTSNSPSAPTIQAAPASSVKQQPAVTSNSTAPRYTEKQLTHNGNKFEEYFWTQDKQQVIVSVPVPAGTRAKTIRVDIKEEFIHVELNGKTLVKGSTCLPVNTDNDYTDWEVVDWERGPSGRRLVRITLIKKIPAGGINVVLWWPKLLDVEPNIDVSAIAERAKNFEEHKKVWQEAHEKFKEQLQSQEHIDV